MTNLLLSVSVLLLTNDLPSHPDGLHLAQVVSRCQITPNATGVGAKFFTNSVPIATNYFERVWVPMRKIERDPLGYGGSPPLPQGMATNSLKSPKAGAP